MKFIKQKLAAIRQRIRKPNVKKLIWIFAGILLLSLPTALAIGYAYQADHFEKTETFSVVLYNSEGKELGKESGTPDDTSSDSLMDIFYDMSGRLTPINQVPGNPDSDPFVRAVTELNGVKSELTFYFSFEKTKSYCIAADGSIYSISDGDSMKFLKSKYAESFYEHSVPPKLTTIDNDTVLPSTIDWYYKNYKDEIQRTIVAESSAESLLYETAGEIGIRFDREPDYCLVRVYDDGALLHEGSYHDLPYITVNSGNELNLQVRAVWNNAEGTQAHGEISYDFRVLIRNRSEFTLSSDSIPAGGFTLLSCTNITDPSKIIFTSNVEGYTPIFHKDGDCVRAFLAFPKETDLQSFQFRIAYGASARSFTVPITKDTTPVKVFTFSDVHFSQSAYAMAQQNDRSALLRQSAVVRNTPVYFRGNFLDPIQNGFRIGYTHNSHIFTAANPIAPLTAFGTEYVTDVPGGMSVAVVNHGVVIQVGSDPLLGTYVLVDHGCGLRTWYGHLSDVNVVIGDVLQKGESVGKTGQTGLATGNGFLLLCTVYQTPIQPEYIIGKEILLP